MKAVRCLPCDGVFGIIYRDFDGDEPIELYREYVVCPVEHHDKIIEDIVEDIIENVEENEQE